MRRDLGLPGHVGIVVVLVSTFAVTAGLSLWYRGSEESAFREALQDNVATLSTLPRLRAGVRRVDLLCELAVSSGRLDELRRRDAVVRNLRDRSAELARGSELERVRGLVQEFEQGLDELLDVQNRWVRAPRDEGIRGKVRESVKDLLEMVENVTEVVEKDVTRRMLSLQSVSWQLAAARFGVELAVVIGLVVYLISFIVRPVLALSAASAQWEVGRPWPMPDSSGIAELRTLSKQFAGMVERINSTLLKERELGEFKTKLVSLVSHEFGNALTVIQSATFIIGERMSAEELKEDEALFSMISSNITMLSGALTNMLSFGRLEAGRLAIDFEATNIASLLQETTGRLAILADKKRISVSLDIPDVAPPLRADPSSLGLALSNLLSNAIKYTSEGGHVFLGIEGAGKGRCRVFVRDTGVGVSQEDTARILSGYYRTERGQKMTRKGFGVGLSLARQIIEAHGGVLALDSVPGKGSTFSFELPVWADFPGNRAT